MRYILCNVFHAIERGRFQNIIVVFAGAKLLSESIRAFDLLVGLSQHLIPGQRVQQTLLREFVSLAKYVELFLVVLRQTGQLLGEIVVGVYVRVSQRVELESGFALLAIYIQADLATTSHTRMPT